jgi:hypothetical protein
VFRGDLGLCPPNCGFAFGLLGATTIKFDLKPQSAPPIIICPSVQHKQRQMRQRPARFCYWLCLVALTSRCYGWQSTRRAATAPAAARRHGGGRKAFAPPIGHQLVVAKETTAEWILKDLLSVNNEPQASGSVIGPGRVLIYDTTLRGESFLLALEYG